MRATSTVTSARCSIQGRSATGSTDTERVGGSSPMSMPATTSTIGADSAHRWSTRGSTAARSSAAPSRT